MDDRHAVTVLPHYRRRGDEVLFALDSVPVLRLGADEVEAFDGLVEGVPASQLGEGSPAARRLAERLCARGMAIELPPQAEPGRGPHLLVIEPHMDDAVLSVGGQLLLRRATHRITVLTLVRWSEFTKAADAPLDRAQVSALRLAESRLAARIIGFSHEVMDELDFPVRLREEQHLDATGASLAAVLAAAKRFGPPPAEVTALAERIFARVRAVAPEEVWLPLGVGENPDHVRTALACLQMLCTEATFFADKRLSFYEDLAPLPHFAGHIERIIAVHATTAKLRRVEENIGAVVADKVRAVSVYASQFDMEPSSRPMSNLSALLTAGASDGAGPTEVRYELSAPPRVPPFGAITFRPAELAAAKVALAPWIRVRSRVRRVVVCNQVAFGRWPLGLEVLSRVFPNAAIEVLAAADHVMETSTASSPRVSCRAMPSGVEGLDPVPDVPPAESVAFETLVLLIGGGDVGRRAAPTGRVACASFGDAIMALDELTASGP